MIYGSHEILIGDVLERLATLPERSVHCAITSPPYYGLRDYGTAEWEGGDDGCDHVDGVAAAERDRNRAGLANNADSHDGGSRTGVSNEINKSFQYRDTCGKCGARRIDRQIGLEATPDLFVARMVEVFRAVKRVLRDDGTLWLNLGDSYASSPASGGERIPRDGIDKNAGAHQRTPARDWERPPGLKPKDLVGIPWSVAKALQQPYYTGTIRSVEDRIWLACAIDAEGCIFIHKRKIGQSNGQGYVRKSDSFGSGLEVANTNKAFVDRCLAITGKGSICHQDGHGRKQRIWRWNLRSNECRNVLREVYPYLVAKQHEARLAIGCPSSGPQAAEAHESLKKIHNGHEPTIDFPAPALMFEQGWYLRSDIIWSKANPMPESVTDRPTKAHEYLFLLTKQPRYFYDADAVREAAEYGRREQPDGEARPWGNLEQRAGGRTVSGGDPSAGRNLRSVWQIPTQSFAAAHFATFPEKLVEPCIKAGTSEKGCCPECGKPWERVVEAEERKTVEPKGNRDRTVGNRNGIDGGLDAGPRARRMVGWRPGCECCPPDIKRTRWEKMSFDEKRHYWTEREWAQLPPSVPCVVLDPFCGSGTTLLVANRLGRDAIGIELNPEYAALAEDRIGKGLRPATHRSDTVEDAPLFQTTPEETP